MKRVVILMAVAGLLALVQSVWAQGTNPTVSDNNYNAAGGTSALTNCLNNANCVGHNTAFGSYALAVNTIGDGNTAIGDDALELNTTGNDNTATGWLAMGTTSAITGSDNTATGFQALYSNTGGSRNTATGSGAMGGNGAETGVDNTAAGYQALLTNTIGNYNTATGSLAMAGPNPNSGNFNTATGYQALYNNSSGGSNIATGVNALYHNTTGYENTASGDAALFDNTGGFYDIAIGVNALFSNTKGSHNTATGGFALDHVTTGGSNVGLGYSAGYNVTTGSNNIEIGSLGSASDANTIRLGAQGTQKATYIVGIFGTPMSGGGDVVVNSSGQLGVLSSSARYKRDIQPMADRSQGLWQLHPVTFRYKQDPSERQYGLIAEEVATVYPELVVRGDKGEVESVQYRELIPLMLNEMQRQRDQIQQQQTAVTALKTQNMALEARLELLEQTRKTAANR
jgi:hypothetical protein